MGTVEVGQAFPRGFAAAASVFVLPFEEAA